MSPQRLEKFSIPDWLVISLFFTAAMIALASSDDIGWPRILPFTLIAGFMSWLFVRNRRRSRVPANPRLSSTNIEKLRREILTKITDTLPRAIVGLNPNTDVIYANTAARNMLSPNMVGRPIGAYLRSSDLRSSIEDAFNGDTPPSLPIHILEPTERHIEFDLSPAILIDPEDKRSAIVFAVLADRTQSTITQEQQADFLANASHELKTPIASIKGYIETLRGPAKNDTDAREKFLKIMSEQSDRMERLVTDLLSLRRIESSEHLAPSEIADLYKAIEAARDSVSLLAEKRDITLQIDLPENPCAPTFGKTDECVQLLLNLMENAIKLSPSGGTVKLSLERLPNWTGQAFEPAQEVESSFRRIVNLVPSKSPVWRVIISDQGPGFSRAHLPRIGERFYRVAGDLPAQEKGTGLGLAIVKHIVLRHRAGLYVKSLHASDSKGSASGTSFSVIFAAKVETPEDLLSTE